MYVNPPPSPHPCTQHTLRYISFRTKARLPLNGDDVVLYVRLLRGVLAMCCLLGHIMPLPNSTHYEHTYEDDEEEEEGTLGRNGFRFYYAHEIDTMLCLCSCFFQSSNASPPSLPFPSPTSCVKHWHQNRLTLTDFSRCYGTAAIRWARHYTSLWRRWRLRGGLRDVCACLWSIFGGDNSRSTKNAYLRECYEKCLNAVQKKAFYKNNKPSWTWNMVWTSIEGVHSTETIISYLPLTQRCFFVTRD